VSVENHTVSADPRDLISPPHTLATLDLSSVAEPDVNITTTIPVTRSGTVHGVLGWFRAQLSDGVSLTNEPPLSTPSWAQTLLPLESPIAVEAGAEIELNVGTAANGSHWTWRVTAPGGESPQQSTLWGFPVPPSVAAGDAP
jgi:type I protein arginine methyltransferase